ncbi:kinase-like domain-containing protein [Gongronella butleri]|nr:kinase-like domain-containing protein [Gongronella butleri]
MEPGIGPFSPIGDIDPFQPLDAPSLSSPGVLRPSWTRSPTPDFLRGRRVSSKHAELQNPGTFAASPRNSTMPKEPTTSRRPHIDAKVPKRLHSPLQPLENKENVAARSPRATIQRSSHNVAGRIDADEANHADKKQKTTNWAGTGNSALSSLPQTLSHKHDATFHPSSSTSYTPATSISGEKSHQQDLFALAQEDIANDVQFLLAMPLDDDDEDEDDDLHLLRGSASSASISTISTKPKTQNTAQCSSPHHPHHHDTHTIHAMDLQTPYAAAKRAIPPRFSAAPIPKDLMRRQKDHAKDRHAFLQELQSTNSARRALAHRDENGANDENDENSLAHGEKKSFALKPHAAKTQKEPLQPLQPLQPSKEPSKAQQHNDVVSRAKQQLEQLKKPSASSFHDLPKTSASLSAASSQPVANKPLQPVPPLHSLPQQPQQPPSQQKASISAKQQQPQAQVPASSSSSSSARPPRKELQSKVVVHGYLFQVLNVISSGGSCTVYRVFSRKLNRTVALKYVQKSTLHPEAFQACLEEIKFLRYFEKHSVRYVPRFFTFEQSPKTDDLYIVMEEGSYDLTTALYNMRQSPLRMETIRDYWYKMVRAVKSIHDVHALHRDLKPHNMLVMPNSEFKLIDFGISIKLSSDTGYSYVSRAIGTPAYMSPESFRYHTHEPKRFRLTLATDIWALGCILYEMIYGRTPFADDTGKSSSRRVCDPTYAVPYATAVRYEASSSNGRGNVYPYQRDYYTRDANVTLVDPKLIDTIKRCLHHNPKARPTAATLLGELDAERADTLTASNPPLTPPKTTTTT